MLIHVHKIKSLFINLLFSAVHFLLRSQKYEILARLGQEERKCTYDKNFTQRSALTLKIELGSMSLYIIYPKPLLGLSMSQIGPRGEKICSGQVMTDKMNGQVDNFRVTAKQSLKIFLNYLKCQSVYIHH